MLLPRLLGLLAVALPSLALADHSFENTAIVRTVDLLGSIVHVTTTYAVKALQGASTYTIALSEEDAERTSFIEVKVKGGKDVLPLKQHLSSSEGYESRHDIYAHF
jgi:oligosaccharyltransferase complex subunit alpha (ribophorin I)